MPRIALNGLGRIGKLALRNLIGAGAGGIEIKDQLEGRWVTG